MYAAALDLRKAFDSVSHFKLFSVLLRAGVPLPIVDVIRCWYSKLFVQIRWNHSLSFSFCVGSGVRQGSLISPTLFNFFINVLITHLRDLDIGCHIDKMFFGIFLYADDILILSPSLLGLQHMVNECISTCDMLSLAINLDKSSCIVFGHSRKLDLASISVKNINIQWVESLHYLGVNIVSGIKPAFCYDKTKRSFYAAFNSVISRAKPFEQLLQLSLVESYCLPLLTYACGALCFSQQQLRELNACWNNAFRAIFSFSKWESVKSFICGLGRLNLIYLIKLARVKSLFHLLQSDNYLLYDLLFVYIRERFDTDDCLKLLFVSRSHALQSVYRQFSVDCNL